MELAYNIYVYELKNGKKLLYPKISNNRDTIDNCNSDECAFLYQEIVKNNPIVRLNHIKQKIIYWQIDACIHIYMQMYGMENVRGGRYNTLVLSESAKNEISESIKYFAYGLEDQDRQIYQYYEHKDNLDFEIDYYRENVELYERTDLERKRYEIDRTIIYDLNQLIRIIQNGGMQCVDAKYYKLMEQLSQVYKQYINVVEDSRDKIRSLSKNCTVTELFFNVPYVFFDSRVIKREREMHNYDYELDKSLIYVIKVFELAIYTLINKEDEFIFELLQIDLQENQDKLFILESHLSPAW